MNNSYITIIKEKRTALSRKRIPLNQNGCTANFRIGVPFEQNLHTGAAYIFSRLKMLGVNAELVTEFAKDKVWENNEEVFNNQAYIFGKQSFKISRCANKVDVIITDSPLPLSIFYNHDPLLTENFNSSVMDVFNGYKNVNFLITRTKPYNPIGRQQTEKESDDMKKPIIDLLTQREITYQEVPGEVAGYDAIVNKVLLQIKDKEELESE